MFKFATSNVKNLAGKSTKSFNEIIQNKLGTQFTYFELKYIFNLSVAQLKGSRAR